MSNDDPRWWAASGADDAVYAMRTAIVDAAIAYLRANAATPPLANLRSLEIAVAQFWSDQADDECHLHVNGSRDADPIGLHPCAAAGGDDDERRACEYCARLVDVGSEYDMFHELNLYGPLIPVVEAMCVEGSDQWMTYDAAYRPWLVVRFADGDSDVGGVRSVRAAAERRVEVIEVGALARPWLDLPQSRAARMPLSARALAAASVAREPGGLVVLADALQDDGDPRGDALAASSIDRALARTWLGALDPHVPRSALALAGGIPDSIGFYFAGYADIDRDERMPFAFRPRVRFLPGSARFIWPALALARSLGPLDAAALAQIARSPIAFEADAIELDLAAARDAGDLFAALAAARANLPRLRKLRVAGAGCTRAAIAAASAADLGPLARLEVTTLGVDAADHAADVSAWRGAHLGVPVAVAMFDADAHRACGWVVEPDGSLLRRRYHPLANADHRAALAAVLR